MQKLLIFSLLLAAFNTHAQQAPWASLPPTKKTINIYEQDASVDVTVHLKLDTLFKLSSSVGRKDVISQWWYTTQAVGYGYVDAQERPYGLWKYYIPDGRQFQLYCEGFYTAVDTSLLTIDSEFQKRVPSGSQLKEEYISALPDRLLITGEWRFYENGRLNKIAVLSNRAILPLETQEVFDENGNNTNSILVWVKPDRRLAGQLMTTADLSADGYLKSIRSEHLSLDFDRNGKPLITPPYDLQ